MTQKAEETIKYIQTIKELNDQEKKQYEEAITNGADSGDVLDQIEDTLQKKLDTGFEKAGVALDENDPEYKAKHQEMMNELQSAEDEFNNTMNEIEAETDKFQKETLAQIDVAKIQAVRSDLGL